MSSAVKILGIAGGVGAAIILGIIAYGEMTKPPGSTFLEKPTEQWTVGNSLRENMVLTYTLSHIDNDYKELIVTLKFLEKQDDNWKVAMAVQDQNEIHKAELMMTESLVLLGPIPPELQPYGRMVTGSILWIVDYAIEPKYLVNGAVWGSIIHGVQKEDLKIISSEPVKTDAGTFNSYVLSYTIKDRESKIWIVKDMPLPVKAMVHDADGNLQFAFNLINVIN